MSSREEIAKGLKEHYKLNDIQITNVLEMAYSLSERRDTANDFALAYYLNERAIGLFSLIADNNNTPDVNDINRSYILIVEQLKRLYARNPELEAIQDHICWKGFDHLDYIRNEIWGYTNDTDGDYGQSHNAKVNRLCIVNGKQIPDIAPDIKKVVDEAIANGQAFFAELEDDEPVNRSWFIPEYNLVYKIDGSIVINEVLTVKKTQSGLASDRLMTQAIANEGEQFKPDFGKKYSRNLTTTLSGMGFKKNEALQQLFFPTATNDGIVFRSHIGRIKADAERINTRKLDAQLQKLGAKTEQVPFDISDIPF